MITIKSKSEIKLMKDAGKLLAETLQLIEEKTVPGITTLELDTIAEKFIRKHGGIPAFKGVQMPGAIDFPGTLCTSVNEQVVHGIPGDRMLQNGDILSVDCGVLIGGYYSDAARTIPVGKISAEAKKLIEVTRESFFMGMDQAIVNNRIYNISAAIEDCITKEGYSAVRNLFGHGIGEELWEDPTIPNFRTIKKGPRLSSGMTLAIEPMINIGGHSVKTLADGWTVITADHSLSAHYENTVLITDNGPEILTVT